jgi:hypothetical protein
MSFVSLGANPPTCLNCAFYNSREKSCSKFIIEFSKNIHAPPHYEKAVSVRLDPHRCGPEGKLYAPKTKIDLRVVHFTSEESWK